MHVRFACETANDKNVFSQIKKCTSARCQSLRYKTTNENRIDDFPQGYICDIHYPASELLHITASRRHPRRSLNTEGFQVNCITRVRSLFARWRHPHVAEVKWSQRALRSGAVHSIQTVNATCSTDIYIYIYIHTYMENEQWSPWYNGITQVYHAVAHV